MSFFPRRPGPARPGPARPAPPWPGPPRPAPVPGAVQSVGEGYGMGGVTAVGPGQQPWTSHTLVGHKGRVFSVAFEPGGGGEGGACPLLASASEDGTVRFWGLMGGAPPGGPVKFKCRGRMEAHKDEVLCLGWAPGGRLLASGGADGLVRVWELGVAGGGGAAGGGCIPSGGKAGGAPWGGEFPSRQNAAAAGSDEEVEAKEVFRLDLPDQVYESLLLGEGKLLTACADAVQIWDMQAGGANCMTSVRCQLLGDAYGGARNAAGTADVFGVAVSEGKLAIANSDGTVRVHCSRTGAPLACLHCSQRPVTKCLIDSEGHTVSAGTGDGQILLHDLRMPGQPLGQTDEGHDRPIYDMLHWAARPGWLLSCSSDCTVKAWETTGQPPLRPLTQFFRDGYPFHSLSAEPSGRWLAMAGGNTGFLGTPLYVYDLQQSLQGGCQT